MGSAAGSVETGNSALVLNESEHKFTNTGGIIALGLTTLTGLIAGVLTARSSHKKYKNHYAHKMKQTAAVMENPYVLAFKALGWGTVWAVGGVSLITFCGCLLLGIRNMDDLRARIRKNRGPVDESTNFETFQDFYNYLINESKKSKSRSEKSESKS